MVEIFLENSILSYELGWMGRASTNILKVVGVRAPIMVQVATSSIKWPKKQKFERNKIELRSLHQSIRLDELVILVGSNVQIGCKMA